MAFVQGSDTWNASLGRHALSGIGARRTWVKASRPDLVGIRHALADPDLRIRLGTAPPVAAYPVVQSVELVGGFLGGQKVTLCPDLNCLLGGTGAGKSLVLEAIRYALDQQVDASAFPAVREEVQSRLKMALGAGEVKLQIAVDGRRYLVERPFSMADDASPTVYQETGGEWARINAAPADLITLAAFSQGEVLEYSRRPAGRMSLVDVGIDISSAEAQIASLKGEATRNGAKLLAARKRVARLRETAGQETGIAGQVRQLAALFDTEVVKQQEGWTQEGSKLTKTTHAVGALQAPAIKAPSLVGLHDVAGNHDLFAQTSAILQALKTRLDAATAEITAAISEASQAIGDVRTQWQTRYENFQAKLDAELEKVDGKSSLTSLRMHLGSLQEMLAETKAAKEELAGEAIPDLRALETAREDLINSLHAARKERRELRRARVNELNEKTAGFVRIDVPDGGDFEDYRKALDAIKVGSRVRDNVLDAIAQYTYPTKFARLLWQGQVNDLVDVDKGIDAASIARLYANIDEKNLWRQLLDVQLIDRPDVLTVKFKKPDDGTYTLIENLAHGQRCTAILIILLADGDTPVIVDQPEDALHAPWIEEYLVDRLRALRGSRQYVFATRSPGIVVGGDAEQIITMRATAGHGELEASGSLERHDLNRLALYHLEGGPVPFSRRAQKLAVSTSQK
jgi:AAA domain